MDKATIQDVLRAHGVTQRELAQRLGITRQSLDKSINRNLTTGRLEEIANAIGISPAEFYLPPNAMGGLRCPHCGKSLTITVE
jgi:transcriptional regulator with XRE-family HTH domain